MLKNREKLCRCFVQEGQGRCCLAGVALPASPPGCSSLPAQRWLHPDTTKLLACNVGLQLAAGIS